MKAILGRIAFPEPSVPDAVTTPGKQPSRIESAGSGVMEPTVLMAEAQAVLDRSPKRCALATIRLDTDDLDRRLGAVGTDALAVAAISRLVRTLRPGDGIATTGRGRFTLLIADLHGPLDAWTVSGRVVHLLRAPFDIAGERVAAKPGVAVVVGTNKVTSADELLGATESALEAQAVDDIELNVVTRHQFL